MANVKNLQDKKTRLSTQLETLQETTDAKVIALTESHEKKVAELRQATEDKITDLTEKHDSKVKATQDGIAGKQEKLTADIAEVDKTLQEEVATLQAQIEAIRGISETVVPPVATESDAVENGEGDLV